MLGFPTANLDPAAFKEELKGVPRGVYCGFASVDCGPVYKAVLSLGYNPHFGNKEETVEAYILNTFDEDFYGEEMRLLICGYLRPQWEFKSGLDELIAAIQADVDAGDKALSEVFAPLGKDALFTGPKKEEAGPGSTKAQQPVAEAASL